MRREELPELQFITPIENLCSILERGILSHNRMRKLKHQSIAMPEIQEIRADKQIPGGLRLHDYANLYICARNPMMYKRRNRHAALCVLAVSTAVLDLPDVVVTDQNAASNYVRFSAAPNGLSIVDRERTFARNWVHPLDQIEEYRHKARKCAEVLVPNRVPPEHIQFVRVSGVIGRDAVQAIDDEIEVRLDADLFFQ
jgi:hypothetical protein